MHWATFAGTVGNEETNQPAGYEVRVRGVADTEAARVRVVVGAGCEVELRDGEPGRFDEPAEQYAIEHPS